MSVLSAAQPQLVTAGVSDNKAPALISRPPRWEVIAVLAMLSIFFLVCFVGRNHHLPGADDVQTIEAGANWHYGIGFRLLAFRNPVERQASHKFFFANVPVYPFVAALWYGAFSFSNATARTLNYLLVAIAGFAVWLAAVRLNLIRGSEERLLMLAVFFLSSPIAYASMSIRYDAWELLVCAVGLLLCTVESAAGKCGLFVLGVILPLSGIHLPPYVVLLSLVIAMFMGTKVLRRLLPLYAGTAAGILTLFGLFWWKGVIREFFFILNMEGGQSLPEKVRQLSYYFHLDMSLFLLVLLAAGFAVSRRDTLRKDLPVRMALVLGIGLPLALFLMRRFGTSYAWMAFTPVLLCVFAVLGGEWRRSGTPKRVFLGICLLLVCGIGLPKTLAGMVLQWPLRDYGVVERFVAGQVRGGDVVLCDYPAYFAMKPITVWTYPIPESGADQDVFFRAMTPADRGHANVLVVDPREFKRISEQLGGSWTAAGPDLNASGGYFLSRHIPSRFGYHFAVYRRVLR